MTSEASWAGASSTRLSSNVLVLGFIQVFIQKGKQIEFACLSAR